MRVKTCVINIQLCTSCSGSFTGLFLRRVPSQAVCQLFREPHIHTTASGLTKNSTCLLGARALPAKGPKASTQPVRATEH
jgi:hypothetical protein